MAKLSGWICEHNCLEILEYSATVHEMLDKPDGGFKIVFQSGESKLYLQFDFKEVRGLALALKGRVLEGYD